MLSFLRLQASFLKNPSATPRLEGTKGEKTLNERIRISIVICPENKFYLTQIVKSVRICSIYNLLKLDYFQSLPSLLCTQCDTNTNIKAMCKFCLLIRFQTTNEKTQDSLAKENKNIYLMLNLSVKEKQNIFHFYLVTKSE